MIRRILAAAALFCATALHAQSPSAWTQWPSTWIQWNGGIAASFYSVLQNNGISVPQESTLNFIPGSNVSFTFTDSPGGGGPGTGVTNLTINSSAGGSGPLLSATDAVNTAPVRGGMVVANSTPKWAQVALGTAGAAWIAGATDPSWSAPLTTYQGSPPQVLGYNGTTTSAFQRMPWDTTQAEIINTSFYQISSSDGVTVVNGFNVTVTGASAGFLHNKNTATDANHINFMEMSTGTTTTGGSNLGLGQTGATTGFIITGGEILDWLIDVPVASNNAANGNIFRVSAGFADTSATTTITNGAHISWDNNTDTHWALTTVKAGTSTGTLNVASTNTATVGWHHLTAYFNDTAHVHFYVDGVELSNSPFTTNLPTTVPVFPFVRILASAGCATSNLCVVDTNTIYFYKPVAR